MADRPLPLPAPMVRATLAGRKTQHRAVLLRPTDHFHQSYTAPTVMNGAIVWTGPDPRMTRRARGSYAVGDRLWVRETWAQICGENMVPQERRCLYRSDATDNSGRRWGSVAPGDPAREVKWRPSTRMPRWASRITLVVTEMRVMRLKEISTADAISEGLVKIETASALAREMNCDWGFEGDHRHGSPVSAYAALWGHINGPESWEANPWVVATTFTVHRCNIDAMEAAHG